MKIDWKTCFRICVSAFLLYLCIHYLPAAADFLSLLIGACTPLLTGFIIAYLVNILMSFYERHFFTNQKNDILKKIRRPFCMISAFFTLILIVMLIFIMIIPQLADCIRLLFRVVPETLNTLFAGLEDSEWLANILPELPTIENWQDKIAQLAETLINGIGGIMGFLTAAISSVFSKAMNLFLGIIFSIYLLLGKNRLQNQIRRTMKAYLPDLWMKRLLHIYDVLNDCFHRYIVGQCMEAVILGSLCAVGMMIFGFPYATMIGALIGFTALIPVAGAYIGGGIGAFMIMTVSPIQAVLFIVFLVVLQQLEGNLIYPKVVGSSIGLPGIWVLAAVTLGGSLLGIFGMLLAVPLAAAAYRLLKEDVLHRES
ncbi:MAG: AI-2E family transporter [Lachnospiraceae bacterium]